MRQIILPEDKLNQLAQQASDRLYEGHYFKQGVIRGEELKSFANHEQINRFLLFQVYQVWNMQLTKLKHPYFDFDPPEIQETLKVLRNQLSRHISISQKEFKPMLRRAVYNNFKLILTPEEAFTTFFFNNREQLSIEEFERYTAFFSDFDFIVKNILRYHQKNNLNLVEKETFFQKMQKIVNLYHQKTGSDVDQYRDELFQKLANRKLSEIVSESETEERQRVIALEAEKRKEEEMRLRAEQELRRKAEQELRRKAEEELRRKAEEESRRKAEEEEERRKEEAERKRLEEEERRKEEEARIKAEEERRRLEEETRRKAEEELARQRELEEQEKREKLRKTSLFESLSGSAEESFLDLDIDDEDQKSGISDPVRDRDSVMDFGFSNNVSERTTSFPEVEKPTNDFSYESDKDNSSTSTQSPLETYLQKPEPESKEETPVARQESKEVEEKEEKPRTIFDSIKANKDNENSNGSGTTVFERDKKETTASFLDRFLNSKKEEAPKTEASRSNLEPEVKETEKEPETPKSNSVVDQQNSSAAPTVGDKLKEQTQSSGTVQVHENLNGNRKIKLNEIPIHKQYQFVQKVFEGNNVRFRIIVDKVNNANGKDEVEAILNKFVLSNESIDHNDSVVLEFLELLRNRF